MLAWSGSLQLILLSAQELLRSSVHLGDSGAPQGLTALSPPMESSFQTPRMINFKRSQTHTHTHIQQMCVHVT